MLPIPLRAADRFRSRRGAPEQGDPWHAGQNSIIRPVRPRQQVMPECRLDPYPAWAAG